MPRKNNINRLLIIVIIIISFISLYYLFKRCYLVIGGNSYLFDTTSFKLSKLNIKNNDSYFKYLIECFSIKYKNNKRKYLFDTSARTLHEESTIINVKPHTILNLRNNLNLNDIKYITTIEFNEDYKNIHWYKSILSDSVNMAIFIEPELFKNNIVTNSDINNQIIPFKNIHFNYKSNFFNQHLSMPKFINSNINIKLVSMKIIDNKPIYSIIEDHQKKINNFFKAFEYILIDNYEYSNYMFDFYGEAKLTIYKFENINNFDEYIKLILVCHLIESGHDYDSNSSIIDNYKQALLKCQTKSNYLLKLFDINSLNEINLKFILKNEEITCPNPDCFMVEFK